MAWKQVVWPEPRLQFKREPGASHPDPRYGLCNYGPLDFNTGRRAAQFAVKLDVLCKNSDRARVEKLLQGLTGSYDVKSAGSRVRYPGFEEVYKARLELPKAAEYRLLDNQEIKRCRDAGNAFEAILYLYNQKLEDIAKGGAVDRVLVLHIPAEFAPPLVYEGRDLRAEIKALGIRKRLKTQIITERALTSTLPCDNYWNFSVALYAQAGGLPWKIEGSENFNCFVGVSFGIKKTANGQDVLVGLAEVFDEFGEHVTIEAVDCRAEAHEFFETEGAYHLEAAKAEQLIKLAVESYSRARKRLPEVLTIHKTTPFKRGEREGFLKSGVAKTNLVYVKEKTHLRLIPDGGYPPKRGTFWKIDERTGLLYTTGVVSIGRQFHDETYPGLGVAHPLELGTSHAVSNIENIGFDLLKLTKMSFNSTKVMLREPITLELAEKVVQVLKTGTTPEGVFKDFRFYM